MKAIEKLDNVQSVSPSVTGTAVAIHDSSLAEDVQIKGKSQTAFLHENIELKSGRALNVLDCNSENKVCILGGSVAETIFPAKSPLGQSVIINGMTFNVIGVLAKTSDHSLTSDNNSVIMPYTTAMSLLHTGTITGADVYIAKSASAHETTAEIEQLLFGAWSNRNDGYTVTNMQNVIDTVKRVTDLLTGLLIGLASIALVVGGIGIMNMMLVSVSERTAEIGLRKALGAPPSLISRQFITESLFLSLFGGILGIFVGYGTAFAACKAIGVSFAPDIVSTALALFFSLAVGLIFGYTPAKKAGKLNPITALRA
jgi:putative ABC transport system permease protein